MDKIRQGHILTILMRQMLEYYRIFAKQLKLLPPEPEYQIFIIHQRPKKMVNYYLLQWVQALQYMVYTNTLNK